MSLRLGDIAPNFQQESSEGIIDFYEFLGDDWGILFSCHALLQYCVYKSVSAGIIQTISAGYHSDVLRWSCMAQIRNTGSA